MNPLNWFRSKSSFFVKGTKTAGQFPQGPYTALFESFIAREVNPFLYEAIRESLGFVDGAINRLKMLDGILRVETENDALRLVIEDWMDNVGVNDLDNGFQAFYEMMGNEMYEQGFGLGEYVLSETADDIERLVVADSKGVHFQRDRETKALRIWYRPYRQSRGRGDGTDQLERVLRNRYAVDTYGASGLESAGYVELDPSTLIRSAFHPEANNPYGVSLIRSNEFDARVLLTMKNAVDRVWHRYGDPALHLSYKTKNPKASDQATLDERRVALGAKLDEVMKIKSAGNSGDFVTAIGRDDELKIEVIGHDAQALEVEMPARFILESVVAKSGLAPWMLGLVWGTSERLAQRQADAALHDSKVRFERRRPALTRVVATMLRARGVTWKPGDWKLIQEVPSLQDLVNVAQADFLTTQADLMRGQAGEGVDIETGAKVNRAGEVEISFGLKSNPVRSRKSEGEPWAEPDPELPKIAARAEKGLLKLWGQVENDVLDLLDLGGHKSAEPVFEFDAVSLLPKLDDMLEAFIGLAGAEEGPLIYGMYAAWVRGLENAADKLSVEAMIEADRAARRTYLAENGMEQVRVTAVSALREDIIADLEDGVYDGQNPKDVARQLRQRFDIRGYDWERLAVTEIAQAQSLGQEDQFVESGIEEYDYVTSGDSKVSKICRALAENGPYKVRKGPLPARDSHPGCRCSIDPHEE